MFGESFRYATAYPWINPLFYRSGDPDGKNRDLPDPNPICARPGLDSHPTRIRCKTAVARNVAQRRARSCATSARVEAHPPCLSICRRIALSGDRNLTLCNVFHAIRANRQIRDKSIVLPGNFRLTKPLFLRSKSPAPAHG
ncbi:hypothetical protein [Paraburkholderia solisilvae]|uniref:hypothetical protein n=1 Tax=Paraburkholderia solisilvae TaxID=624376 RepID=UPI0035EE41F8